VWAQAYGEKEPTTCRLGELLAARGDLEGAVHAWDLAVDPSKGTVKASVVR